MIATEEWSRTKLERTSDPTVNSRRIIPALPFSQLADAHTAALGSWRRAAAAAQGRSVKWAIIAAPNPPNRDLQ